MFDWNAVMVQEERANDLLRDAEQERLLRRAQAVRPDQTRRAGEWIRGQLMVWEAHLSKRPEVGYRPAIPHLQEGK
jgi:hypothetical protein